MKKIIVSLFLLSLCSNLYSQKFTGVWVSNNNLIHKTSGATVTQDGVSMINFDLGVMTAINSSDNNTIKLNRKETKLKIKGLKGKFSVNKSDENDLVITSKDNKRFSFKKLNSSHKLDLTNNEISEFILNQQCGLIQDIQLEFKNDQFFIDKRSKKPLNRFQVINYSDRDNGYWYTKKINGYAVFVFTTEQNSAENIFQITSLDLKGFKLNQLYSDKNIKNLDLIKTCL